jgi:hypothetical protein
MTDSLGFAVIFAITTLIIVSACIHVYDSRQTRKDAIVRCTKMDAIAVPALGFASSPYRCVKEVRP